MCGVVARRKVQKSAEDGWRIPDRSSFMTLQYRAFMWETDDNLMTQYTVYLVVPCYGIIARKNISFSLHYLQIQRALL